MAQEVHAEEAQALNADKIPRMPCLTLHSGTTLDRISAYAASTSGTADLSIDESTKSMKKSDAHRSRYIRASLNVPI